MDRLTVIKIQNKKIQNFTILDLYLLKFFFNFFKFLSLLDDHIDKVHSGCYGEQHSSKSLKNTQEKEGI